MEEKLYDVVITQTTVFVRPHEDKDKPGEHTTAVHNNKTGACNIARKLARQHELKYIKWK